MVSLPGLFRSGYLLAQSYVAPTCILVSNPGYGFFQVYQKCGFGRHFSVAENAIIQTTSVAVSTMPVTAGFISVIPAMSMLTVKDNPPHGPQSLSYGNLVLWTLAVAFFGAFIALPLRKQTIVKEKLKFPTGAATAKVIELLHQNPTHPVYFKLEQENNDSPKTPSGISDDDDDDLELGGGGGGGTLVNTCYAFGIEHEKQISSRNFSEAYSMEGNWSKALPVLLASFTLAFLYKLLSEYVTWNDNRILVEFPIFTWLGLEVVSRWGWVLYPAPGYIGQGMIMGPKTSISMFFGCIIGFGILGPLAKSQSWAPGEISSLDSGATGWVLWVSLAIMLGESLTSLALLALKTFHQSFNYQSKHEDTHEVDSTDVPASWWIIGFAIFLCTVIVSPMFSMAIHQPIIAVLLAALVAILAVRALGETDLNPASGIGKISQIVFSILAPGKVVANIVAGAIAEAGAIQAGDMMQDFKTAYLLGIPPRPQFFAQLIGSFVSIFVSVGVYALYKTAWKIPGEELSAPSANVWLDMARLFNGGSLPEKVWIFAMVFAILASILVICEQSLKSQGNKINRFLPSGIGFAIGMYIGPKFTIPRLIGCGIERLWLHYAPSSHGDLMIVVASGFVLGEGTGAIFIAFVKMFNAIY
eukprot:g7685.t1